MSLLVDYGWISSSLCGAATAAMDDWSYYEVGTRDTGDRARWVVRRARSSTRPLGTRALLAVKLLAPWRWRIYPVSKRWTRFPAARSIPRGISGQKQKRGFPG